MKYIYFVAQLFFSFFVFNLFNIVLRGMPEKFNSTTFLSIFFLFVSLFVFISILYYISFLFGKYTKLNNNKKFKLIGIVLITLIASFVFITFSVFFYSTLLHCPIGSETCM